MCDSGHSLVMPFFRIGLKTDIFQSCFNWWVFQMSWHIECSTFIESSVSLWNRSTGIPSAPLVFSIVMIHKDGLISHSKMSGSRWVIIPSWISGYWRSFLYSSSVYYLHLFLIHSASVKSVPLLFFILTIFAWNVPLVSLIFLNISCLCRYIIFLCFFAFFTKVSFLISSSSSL